MAWTKRIATDYQDCLAQIVSFATKAFEAGTATAGTNTGDGILYGQSASENSVAETWTITCTAGGGSEAAVFSVVGSVTGALDSATCDVPYSEDELSFTILSGTTDFVIGDSFSFAVAASTAKWGVNESSATEVLLQGVGGGSDEIFVGFRTQSNSSTYYNLEISGFTGYISGNTYDNQPGLHNYFTCLSPVSFEFWVWVTGRSIKIVPVIGTIYGGGYTGWFLPNATTTQYGYPMFVGGSTDDYNQLVSGIEDDHTNYWRAYVNNNSGAVYDGTSFVEINKLIPLSYGSFATWRADVDGERTIFPCEVLSESAKAIYGTLEGVYAVANGDNVVTTGDFLNKTTKGLMVFQDTFRTDSSSFVAMDLIGDN